MISVATKFDILHAYFILGKGYRTIAKEFAPMSRNTVKKYVNEFSEQKKEILEGGNKSEILLAMNQEPQYNIENRMRTVVSDEVLELIQGFLDENERKRLTGKAKLCMKATDIHEQLEKLGFTISYPSVCNYVRRLSDKSAEAFIKQHYDFGEVCEFDWGDVPLTINGKEIVLKMAVFTLAASNVRYAFLYRSENTQCFLDAHIRFFAFIGGVPHQMVYDNMRVAIAKFVGRNEKVATTALKQLSTYYGFNFRFCNVRKGNEKGHVERSVEFVRRKAFSHCGTYDKLDAALQQLADTLDHLNSDKELEREKAALLPKMPDYSCAERTTAKVSKYSTIAFSNGHYSVPDYLVGKEVDVYAFVDEITVRYSGNVICTHSRSYEPGSYILDIMHYTRTFLKKPGAIKHSLCLKQAGDALKMLFETHFTDNPKEFIVFLNQSANYTLFDIDKAILTLTEAGVRITSDSIRMVLENHPLPETEGCVGEIEAACEAQLALYEVAI